MMVLSMFQWYIKFWFAGSLVRSSTGLQSERGRTGRCVCIGVCCGPTAVWVALLSGASELVAIFVHTPTLASAAVTLGWFEVPLLSTTRNIRA